MEEKYLHRPVLLKEVLDFLNLGPGKIIIDATVGTGGHAEKILERIHPGGMLIGIDRDIESLNIAHERLKTQNGLFKLIHNNFRNIKDIKLDLGIGEVDGVLFDLGVSSIQLENKERGFSIKALGPLDMRMDRNQRLTVKDLVNTLTENELSDLIWRFGEERFHRRIAKGIVNARHNKEIQTTADLVGIILNSLPRKMQWKRIHPATRTFQAFRIRVNDELTAIEDALSESPSILKKGGRLCVISFHSLEDRIVKNVLKEFKDNGIFRLLTKKVVVPKRHEVLINPRARSAKLRAAERLL